MMNKKIAAILLSLCLPTSLAQAYRTDGQGGVYSFYRLSQTEGSGVTMEIKDGKKNYTLSQKRHHIRWRHLRRQRELHRLLCRQSDVRR